MIGRQSFLIVISNYIIQILGMVGAILLAKLWGAASVAALGIIAFAMSTISMFNIITDLGFSQAHVKRVSEGQDIGTCIGTFTAVKMFLIGLFLLFIFGALFIWKDVFGEGFTDATTESVFIVMIFYFVFNLLRSIPVNTFVGRREIAKRQITELFENLIKLPLEVIVVLAGVTGIVVASGKIIKVPPLFEWPGFLQPIQKFIADHAVGSLAMTYVLGMVSSLLIGLWFFRKYPLKRPDVVREVFQVLPDSFFLPL